MNLHKNNLVSIHPTTRFSIYNIVTLKEAALIVLEEGNFLRKAQKTLLFALAWSENILCEVEDAYSSSLICMQRPMRCKPNINDLNETSNSSSKNIKMMIKKNHIECTVHAIANAESFAIDLFWDLIGRFTYYHLPVQFYNDMVYIAKQEAEHFLSWHSRLQQLSCPFGTFPLSDGLWQSASDTSDDLLARLAIINLTHEAKGLDTYAATREKFVKCNDLPSICILDHNYKEEVGHVAIGVKWFSYICDNVVSQAEEKNVDKITRFHQLSRKYFKGNLKEPFNREARLEAGMTEEWYIPLTEEIVM